MYVLRESGRGTRLVGWQSSQSKYNAKRRHGTAAKGLAGKSPSSSPVIVSVSRHRLVPLTSEQVNTSSSLCDNLFCMNDVYKGP